MSVKLENFQNEILIRILSIFSKRNMAMDALEHPIRKNQQPHLKRVFNEYSLDDMDISHHRVLTFSPSQLRKNIHIVYFHGGAYIWQGDWIHWLFLRNLMHRLTCRASYVDYPLAPEFGYTDTFNMVWQAYQNLVSSYPHDHFVFMGDSAGAGLALAFAQQLNLDKRLIQPQKIILLSPWLDLSLKNPQVQQLATRDVVLSFEALSWAAQCYARGADLSLDLLSPINGKTAGLGEIHIFIGTRDMLWPDCRKYVKKAQKENQRIHLREYENMPHVWMFFPFSQTKDTINQIVKILSE